MIAVDVFGIALPEGIKPWEFNGTLEIDAQVTFYDKNEKILGQLRGDFTIKSGVPLSFNEAAVKIEEIFRGAFE